MTSTQNQDHEHLRLLSIFHYVFGGLLMAISMIPLIHIGIGLALIMAPETLPEQSDTPLPLSMGWLFAGVGLIVMVVGLTLAICLIVSGRFLSKRKGYWFSFVIACLECLNMPLGTVLGVFTILVLSRPSVKELYGISRPSDSSL